VGRRGRRALGLGRRRGLARRERGAARLQRGGLALVGRLRLLRRVRGRLGVRHLPPGVKVGLK